MRCVELGALLLLAAAPALAQVPPDSGRGRWSIGVSLEQANFAGASRETVRSKQRLEFAPHRAALWGLRLAYGRDRVRVGLIARYGQPGVRVRGVPASSEGAPDRGVVVLIENAFHLSSFGAFLSTRLHRLASGPALRGSLTLLLERWASPGAPVRTIGGAALGLGAEAGLGAGFLASVDAELGVTPASPFRSSELPEGYRPASTRRVSLSGAVVWRF